MPGVMLPASCIVRKKSKQLLLILLLLSVAGLNFTALAQNQRWRQIRGRPLVKFDWNCALPSAFPHAALNQLVSATMRDREFAGVGAWGDRAFIFDLNGDGKPEYFIPLDCGGTGNCAWEVFGLNPVRSLGTIHGQYIYVHRRVGRWPAIITYTHLSASEGSLDTYRFSRARYAHIGNNYPIGPEDSTLEIQNVAGRKMPVFLERARAGCENLGW